MMLRVEQIKEEMHPELFVKWQAFDARMKDAGLAYILTSVARSILHQMALFVQGRLPLNDVNVFRCAAGLKAIEAGGNKIVTWTLNSKHVTNMFDKDLNNDFSRAFDIALLKYNRPHWDIKISINNNEIPDYEEAGKIGESVGLRWGGRFKYPDYCHFEVA